MERANHMTDSPAAEVAPAAIGGAPDEPVRRLYVVESGDERMRKLRAACAEYAWSIVPGAF
jgi:hypothetical protein